LGFGAQIAVDIGFAFEFAGPASQAQHLDI
jgi:hypothetical protein